MKKDSDITASGIVVIGASARGACWSVVRAGLLPSAWDFFCDLDFPPGCKVRLIDDESLFASPLFKEQAEPENSLSSGRSSGLSSNSFSRRLVCLPVGGWENDSQMQKKIESHFSLGNTSAEMTSLARDPRLIQQLLQKVNLPCLKVRDVDAACSAGDEVSAGDEETGQGKWMRKPIDGTGGIGVRLVDSQSPCCEPGEYDQQYVEGDSCSAVFFADCHRKIHLLGMTKQLIGCPDLWDRPFAYAGSCGPFFDGHREEEKSIRDAVSKVANLLNETIHFYGLFCFDFVLADGIPYLTEINPRYSASVELLELAFQKSFIRCLFDEKSCEPSGIAQVRGKKTKIIAKAFLYAPRDFSIPEDWNWDVFAKMFGRDSWRYNEWETPIISDLPASGTAFEAKEPVCTLWAEGETMDQCVEKLHERTTMLKNLLKI